MGFIHNQMVTTPQKIGHAEAMLPLTKPHGEAR
jgi:hypothetical protein